MAWTDQELDELEDAGSWDWETSRVAGPVSHHGAEVAVRFSAGEFAGLAAEAERLGMTVTAFVRMAALARTRTPKQRESLDDAQITDDRIKNSRRQRPA